MKRLLLLVILFFAAVGWLVLQSGNGALPHTVHQTADNAPNSSEQHNDNRKSNASLRGAVWVATAYNIDYPAQPTTDVSALKRQCKTILDTAQSAGLDTIYFQVRPSCDALYSSQYFPWSAVLTGKAGQAPARGFDPLRYWVKQAHKRGLRLEAWVNPYRVCAGANAKQTYFSLPKSSPAVQHPEWVVQYDGGYYFDPGIPEVRQLIVDGVTEIVRNYAVDGIQYDDYFYPGEDFDDSASYKKYANGTEQADWRRDNVNQLIQATYDTVHQNAKRKHCVFGVSPSGIWKNGYGDESGSATHGFEHYSQSYADSLTWVKNNWVNYLCPQIYWEIGNDAADFETLVNWWADRLNDTDVSLIVGLAAYKIGDADSGEVWKSDGIGELSRQLTLCRKRNGVDGVAVFSYHNLSQQQGLRKKLHQQLTK